MRTVHVVASLAALGLLACQAPLDGPGAPVGAAVGSIAPGSPDEAAVLAVVNDPAVDLAVLDDDVGLDRRAAQNITAHRDGADQVFPSADDNLFDSITELDDISYVGPSALAALLAYAKANGYYPQGPGGPDEIDYAMLALASDPSVDEATLDDDVRLDRRAAAAIVSHRDGKDGLAGTRDDRIFMSVAELDAMSHVGDGALDKLRAYAVDHGYLDRVPTGMREVVFSPQPYAASHTSRVVQLIDAAESSIDVAMYSFSDENIFDALERAVGRGVEVRFVFDTASSDKNKTGLSLVTSRSARLEATGINVRYVNKIMHHKLMIVDGPRDDAGAAEDAALVTGSANWSYGAATRYDENTLFLDGQPELALRLQAEFDLLWEHSRDFVYDSTLPFTLSTLALDPNTIADGPDAHAFFTSANFNVSGDTFSIVTGRNTIADQLVDAIDHATDSIWIASGHLRSRPVAEALMAKRQSDPHIDIRVYLDGQEYVGSSYHSQQVADRDDCLAAAGTSASKIRQCYDKGFFYGYQVGQSGIEVRYKVYAYRWHYSYAVQMHHKYMLIDGDELWTGSYNLSDNAEHNTFENMIVLRGLPYRELIADYADNFLTIWETGRDRYQSLLQEIETAPVIPLVFDSMALDHAEVAALKQAIAANCADLFTAPYRDEPDKHLVCPR